MKKVVFLVAIFSVTSLFSQNTFQLWNFNAKDGMEGAIAKLADEQWGDAKFKSGGIQIERIGHGDNPWSHRVILFGEVGKIGRVDGDVTDTEWALFQEKFNNLVEEWGTSYAGRFMSIEGGSWVDYPYVQIYDAYEFECNAETFGEDPAPGRDKHCFCYDSGEFEIKEDNQILKDLRVELNEYRFI